MAAKNESPFVAAVRSAEVSVNGRMFERWEGAEGRSTWCRAWIGEVALVVRTLEPAAIAEFLRSGDGYRAAQDALLTTLLNQGAIQGTLAELRGFCWGDDPKVTVEGAAVVFRRSVEIEQDGPPWPTAEELTKREGAVTPW